MFGIDIESMWAETNIPTWRPELNQPGLELNTRIYIKDNYIYGNAHGHFVNADGINVVLEGNTFQGTNIGAVSSYPGNLYVKYLNNTFIETELWVEGDNYVDGVLCDKSNIRLMDVDGAVVTNCKVTNGSFYGSSVYGYLGTPASVDVSTGTFSFSAAHNMGNGAKIIFEQWAGRVPNGISVDKVYYTITFIRSALRNISKL